MESSTRPRKASSKAGLGRKAGRLAPHPRVVAAAEAGAHGEGVVAGAHFGGGGVRVGAEPVFDVGARGAGEALVTGLAVGGGQRAQVEEAVELRGPFLVMDVGAAPVDVLQADLHRTAAIEEDRAARDGLRLFEYFRRRIGDVLAGKFGKGAGALQDGFAAGRSGGGAGQRGQSSKAAACHALF